MYRNFSNYYDRLNGSANYSARAEYVLNLFKKYDKVPSLLLDLCCGTGSFTAQFCGQGIDTIGVDMSEEMLSIARQKCKALFICQKAEELDLYGTVDGAVCMLDSINHITDKNTLLLALKRVRLFLEKDRLFIFDVNTPYKHENILANNCFNYTVGQDFIAWTNEKTKNGTHIFIDIFAKAENAYNRQTVDFYERAYTVSEIEGLLKKSGFSVVTVHDDLSFNPPKEKSERLYFVAKAI